MMDLPTTSCGRGLAFCLVILMLLAAAPAAAVDTLREKNLRWENTDCTASNTCDLSEVRFRSYDYRVWVEDSYSYGTGLSAHYRTDSVSSLPNYGFAQTIRGCVFNTSLQDGKVVPEFGYTREFFGGFVPFQHPDWVVDSVDKDPFYNSYEGYPRHHIYQWNRVPGSIQKATRVFFGVEKPKDPELYVLDYPGTAFYMNGQAKNLSLEFEICLYRTGDVPALSKPEDTVIAGALACFKWASSHIYNHKKKAFEMHDTLDPVCLEKPSSQTPLGPTFINTEALSDPNLDWGRVDDRIKPLLDQAGRFDAR